jgi:elongation factor Ts
MNADIIKKLREETGAGVMECKNALEEAKGDTVKAKEILANSADAIAKKKAERATKNGLIDVYAHAGRIGVIVEVACESDFVAKNQGFREMAHNLALHIASMNPKSIDELMEQEYFADTSIKVSDYIKTQILQIKENIKVKRFVRFEMGEDEDKPTCAC